MSTHHIQSAAARGAITIAAAHGIHVVAVEDGCTKVKQVVRMQPALTSDVHALIGADQRLRH